MALAVRWRPVRVSVGDANESRLRSFMFRKESSKIPDASARPIRSPGSNQDLLPHSHSHSHSHAHTLTRSHAHTLTRGKKLARAARQLDPTLPHVGSRALAFRVPRGFFDNCTTGMMTPK